MGGGAAMRTAAKVAGIGVVNSGIRSFTAEHPVAAAARKAARPVSGISSSSSAGDDLKTNLQHVASPKCASRACSGIDDWEFAGGEEEDLIGIAGREKMPRVVFGGAPSFVEAKEATSELKDALEKAYLCSPASTGYGGSSLVDQDYGYSDVLQTKAHLTSEQILAPAPAPPQHAIHAFRVLSESTDAQNVVASIASDPNVWNAVMQNPALQDFLQSHKSSLAFLGEESVTDPDFVYKQSAKGSNAASSSGLFTNILQDIKLTVIDMWSGLSDYFQSLFGGPTTNKIYPNEDGSARIGFSDKVLGRSFLGLAAMAIVLVVLKRN